MGYEPDGPRQETVYPGAGIHGIIKILIPRRRNKAAKELLDKGIDAYQKGYEQKLQEGRRAVRKGASSWTPLTARRPTIWA